MRTLKRAGPVLAAGLALTLGGCVAVVAPAVAPTYNGYYGPPPLYAPYHGYRYRNSDGLTIVYDSGLRLYLVLGYVGLYWWDGHYYRDHSGIWERSSRHVGPWGPVRADLLPYGLHKRYEYEQRQREWSRERHDDRYRQAPRGDRAPPAATGRGGKGKSPYPWLGR